MESEIYDDLALEQIAKKQFGFVLDINHVVVRDIPLSPTTHGTLLLTKKKQLMLYIHAKSRLTLGDVRKLASRMGCMIELALPPKGQPNYFDDIGREKFRTVFPGRSNPTPEDIRYYRTLAPYNPALLQIREIKNGEVYQYDTDSRSGWRLATKFAYRRIKTS
jgi:hypothetical protein